MSIRQLDVLFLNLVYHHRRVQARFINQSTSEYQTIPIPCCPGYTIDLSRMELYTAIANIATPRPHYGYTRFSEVVKLDKHEVEEDDFANVNEDVNIKGSIGIFSQPNTASVSPSTATSGSSENGSATFLSSNSNTSNTSISTANSCENNYDDIHPVYRSLTFPQYPDSPPNSWNSNWTSIRTLNYTKGNFATAPTFIQALNTTACVPGTSENDSNINIIYKSSTFPQYSDTPKCWNTSSTSIRMPTYTRDDSATSYNMRSNDKAGETEAVKVFRPQMSIQAPPLVLSPSTTTTFGDVTSNINNNNDTSASAVSEDDKHIHPVYRSLTFPQYPDSPPNKWNRNWTSIRTLNYTRGQFSPYCPANLDTRTHPQVSTTSSNDGSKIREYTPPTESRLLRLLGKVSV